MFGRGASSKESKPTAAAVIQHFSQVAVRGRPHLIYKKAGISIQISFIDQNTNRLLIASEFTAVTFIVLNSSHRLQKVPRPHCGFSRNLLASSEEEDSAECEGSDMRFEVLGIKSNAIVLPVGKLSHVARGLQEVAYLADFNYILPVYFVQRGRL